MLIMIRDFRFYLLSALLLALVAAGCSSSETPVATVKTFSTTALVSDTNEYGAAIIDSNLKNPWGIVNAPSAPFWVANNHSSSIGVYDMLTGAPKKVYKLSDEIGSNPTGIVYNSDPNSFIITGNGYSSFIYATESGKIAGYGPTSGDFALAASPNSAEYKGLALGTRAGKPALYAANFSTGTVDVFDANFTRVGLSLDTTSGANAMPSTFAPFNAQMLNGTLYVTYAMRGGDDDVAGVGNGYIDIVNADGTLRRFVSKGTLNSPWGMAIAPAGFGDFKDKLLVGNFGDGKINIYDPANGNYLGQLKDATGNPLVIEGLWALYVNNGELFYTAGADGEEHGVLGKITLH